MNTALKIVGIILLALIGLIVLGWIIKIVSIIFGLLLGVVFIAGVIWLINSLFKLNTGAAGNQTAAFIVQDYTRAAVTLFKNEPSATDILKAQISAPDLETGFDLENNTEVLVLGEAKKDEPVRVRVKSGVHRGQEGWVSSALVHEQKLIEP